MSAENEILNAFRQALGQLNERSGSRFRFVHGTPDGVNESRAEDWNASNSSQRAVGELLGASLGKERSFTVFLFRESPETPVCFELLAFFDQPIAFPEVASEQFNFLTDLTAGIQPLVIPHSQGGQSRMLVRGLKAHGVVDPSGFSLSHALHQFPLAELSVASRTKGGGHDAWSSTVAELMIRGLDSFGAIQKTESGLTPILETIVSLRPDTRWGVVQCTSINSILIYDRDTNAAISLLIEKQELGFATASTAVDGPIGERVFGCLIRCMVDLPGACRDLRRLYEKLKA